MGSWSETCGLSGLGIESGDKVVHLFLSESRNGRTELGGYGLWMARTLPIFSSYDDYGGIQDPLNIESEKKFAELQVESLKKALIDEFQFNNDFFRQNIYKVTTEGIGGDYIVKELMVRSALVRQDVWDHLLATKSEDSFSSSYPNTYEAYRKSSVEMLELLEDLVANPEKMRNDFLLLSKDSSFRRIWRELPFFLMKEEPFKKWFYFTVVDCGKQPFIESPKVQMEQVLQMYFDDKSVSREFVIEFLDRFAQLQHIQDMMHLLRKAWAPQVWGASQDVCWRQLKNFNEFCGNLIQKEMKHD
jgi:hypothetical protein